MALPPGLDANSTKRRVNVAVDLRPSSVQLSQDSSSHQSLPTTYESLYVNTCARMPYLRAVRSAHLSILSLLSAEHPTRDFTKLSTLHAANNLT